MAARRPPLDPDLLLRAYAGGIFPMAENAGASEVFWVEPDLRGVLPLDAFHLSRRLARTVRSDRFEVTVDTDFEAVIDGCAAPAPGRDGTWINRDIRAAYGELFRRGQVHTVETRHDGRLVGGLYGVRLGGAFFGESMFSRETDASKVALVHLVARLRVGGFALLDAQFLTEHLAGFGAIEIPRADYRRRLDLALARPADFHRFGRPGAPTRGVDAVAAAQPSA
ncbi:MAG: leucyl/phenylalanyl-tRNA--protein transferase [Hyphomicrobiales bacterium]|nr:leucyl/phenylalanyl-tRNA--protein transferase [Hyphomicrobiales bacterium]